MGDCDPEQEFIFLQQSSRGRLQTHIAKFVPYSRDVVFHTKVSTFVPTSLPLSLSHSTGTRHRIKARREVFQLVGILSPALCSARNPMELILAIDRWFWRTLSLMCLQIWRHVSSSVFKFEGTCHQVSSSVFKLSSTVFKKNQLPST